MADISAAAFVVSFPEFASVNASRPTFVATALAEGAAMCSEAVWGDLYTQAVFYLAANALALRPFGENARLASDTNSTPYFLQYKRLLMTLPTTRMALGGGMGPYGY